MKKPVLPLPLLFLFFSSSAFASASIHYELSIHHNVYDLFVQEQLPSPIAFSEVAANLRNPAVFKAFDPSFSGLTRSNQTGSDYLLFMEISQYGMKNHSVFHCHESWAIASWSRHCTLDTSMQDGGKYMSFKTEDTRCMQNESTQDTTCTLHYVGKMKDITIDGIQIMPAPLFAVKAKYEAIRHFAKIWYYTVIPGASLKSTLHTYQKSQLAEAIEIYLKKASTQAKKEGSDFQFKTTLDAQYP